MKVAIIIIDNAHDDNHNAHDDSHDAHDDSDDDEGKRGSILAGRSW